MGRIMIGKREQFWKLSGRESQIHSVCRGWDIKVCTVDPQKGLGSGATITVCYIGDFWSRGEKCLEFWA